MRDVGPLMYATVRDDTIMTHTTSPPAFESSPYFRFAAEFTDSNPESSLDSQKTHPISPPLASNRLITAVQRRKNSIEMFLSQSPSQALGNGFLKMSLDDEEEVENQEREGKTIELEREPTPEHHLREEEWNNQDRLYYYPEEGYYESNTRSNTASSSSWTSLPASSRPYATPIPQYSPSNARSYPTQLRPNNTIRSTTRYPIYPPPPTASTTNGMMMMMMDRSQLSPSSPSSPLYSPTTGFKNPMIKPCKFFLQGHCRMGNKCKFAHQVVVPPSQPPPQPSLYPPFPRTGFNPEQDVFAIRMEESIDTRRIRPNIIMESNPTETACILQVDDVIHRVFAMSKDQNGCRLLQEQLDLYEERKEVCDLIYTESMHHLSEMMVDPFGNYLFQKLLERAKPLQKLEMIRIVSHHLVAAALNLHGTRSVQKLVEVCAMSAEVVELDSDGVEARRIKLATLIVEALKEDAVRLCIDSNGNHVIQRALQFLNANETQFIFDAVATECLTVGTHRHGCCVLQRCLDAANPLQKRQVIAQVEKQAMKLMQDPYGNYVVQYVLDSCTSTEALGVMTMPLGHVFELSIQKFSSNVIEKCLEKAPASVLTCYVDELIGYSSVKMQKMLQDQFANYVVQRAICVAMESQCIALVKSICPHLTMMKNTSGGRRITARILKRFPHLDLQLETIPGFGEYRNHSTMTEGVSGTSSSASSSSACLW